MSVDKTFLGRKMMDFSPYPAFQPYSRVTLWVDDNNCYTAGDDTGRTLEADCPWATQAICNAVLAKISGYQYVPYTATDAMLDPSAEIGDGVTANGRYSVLASIEPTFDSMFTATVQAPADEELDHEFPYKSSTTRQFDRKLAQTRAEITVKANEIMLEVQNELDGLSSSLSVRIDEISSTLSGLNGTVSTLSQKVDSFTLSVTNGETSSTIQLMAGTTQISSQTIKFTGDVVFASDLKDGETVISGDNILTGEISADYLKLGGTMNVYSSLTDKSASGSIGYVTGRISGNRFTGIGMIATTDTAVLGSAFDDVLVISTDDTGIYAGGNIDLNASEFVRILGSYFIPSVNKSKYCGSYSYQWGYGYFDTLTVGGSAITGSDRRLKENIEYDISKWMTMFDALKPCSYKFIDGVRTHVGMIAQDVIEAGKVAGLDMEHLTMVCKDQDSQMYGIRYEEFVPILIAKVQQLEKRLEELSA